MIYKRINNVKHIIYSYTFFILFLLYKLYEKIYIPPLPFSVFPLTKSGSSGFSNLNSLLKGDFYIEIKISLFYIIFIDFNIIFSSTKYFILFISINGKY